jgi:peptidyl-prolyl cis-trans isomerase SurA
LPSNPSETQINAAKTQAENVLAEIKGGQDFKQMAMTISAGSRALQGGEMGYLNTNEMPTLFANAIKGKGKNDIVGPIQSGAGFHILTIFDIKGRQTVEIQEVKSRHILVRPSIILSEDKAKEMLSGFIAQIKSGEKTFEELAKKHSEDPGSALLGGVIDWTEPKVFDPAYKEKLETLEIGRISEPFRSDFGWHIVEVLERRTQDATEKRKRDQAHRMLFNRKFNEEVENWYHEIRAQAYIEILPEK